MKRGGRILLFLAVVIIILIAVVFLVFGRGGSSLFGSTPSPTPEMVNIVIVGQPIDRDGVITAEALSSMQIPLAQYTEKMIKDPQTIVGKYAMFPFSQGMPLTVDMISERPGMNQPGSEASKVISPGLVAIAIPLSRMNSVAYGIRDGDRINIIATTLFIDVDPNFQSSLPNFTAAVTGVGSFVPETAPVLSAGIVSGGETSTQGRAELDPTLNQALYLVPSEKQRARLVSQMIVQDIQVLHVGNFSLGDNTTADQKPAAAPPAEGQPAPTAAPPPVPDVITVIVSPQDAVALTYLMYSGVKFNFTLRAPDDTTRVETEAATLQYLLSQYAIPVPAKLPYAMEPRLQPQDLNTILAP
jgi:pilus assembly protein CpaB